MVLAAPSPRKSRRPQVPRAVGKPKAVNRTQTITGSIIVAAPKWSPGPITLPSQPVSICALAGRKVPRSPHVNSRRTTSVSEAPTGCVALRHDSARPAGPSDSAEGEGSTRRAESRARGT